MSHVADELHLADLEHLAEAFKTNTAPNGDITARVVLKVLMDMSSVASSLERIAAAQEDEARRRPPLQGFVQKPLTEERYGG